MAQPAMSTSPLTDPALAFLHGARERSQPADRPLASLGWYRLLLLSAVFSISLFFLWTDMVRSGQLTWIWTVTTAAAITVAALEASRWSGVRTVAASIWTPLVAAAAIGAVVLCGLRVAWPASLLWESEFAAASLAVLGLAALAHLQTEDRQATLSRVGQRVAVVGSGHLAAQTIAHLAEGGPRRRVDRYALAAEPGAAGIIGRGAREALLCDCQLGRIDTIVVAADPDERDLVAPLLHALRSFAQDVYLAPGADPTPDQRTKRIGGADLVLIGARPIRGAPARLKRSFDVLGALGLIAFLAPLLALLAVAIKLETKGPILFRQLRVGYNNQLFYILKFRSMFTDAADALAKQQTVRGDRRITRVGQVIRKLSLDELPQLINVVRGDMSLVGPRPHAPGTSIGGRRVHTLVDDYACRHLVRPGITGLAQVRGLRGGLHDRAHVVARVRADLEYIQRWSFWLDVRILLGTVVLELRDKRGV